MTTSHFFVGQTVDFQNEGSGTVAEVSEDSIFIVSKFFTGWMLMAEYFDLLGIED